MDKYKFIFKLVCGVLITLLINTVLIIVLLTKPGYEGYIVTSLIGVDVAIAGYIFAHNIKPKKE